MNFVYLCSNFENMNRKLLLSVCTLACLSAILSCNKEDKTLPVKTKDISFEEAVGLSTLFPELEKMSSIQYDEKMGYYIPFTRIDWNQGLAIGPVFIPSQTLSFDAKATLAGDEGWYVNDISDIVLSDVHLPSIATKFSWGNCYSAVKLHIALGENVPYRKVILHDFSVRFPDGFMKLDGAENGIIRNLEVTAEGVDVPIWLSSVQNPDQFEDNDGKTCFSVGTGFEARVSVSPEDAAGAVSVKPSELDFRCTLEFDQADFISCRLSFREGAAPVAGSFTWNAAKLPSFLCGENADITLSNPRIDLDYQSDFPFFGTRHDFAVLYGSHKAGFSYSGLSGQITETLEPFFHSPFREGNLQPMLFYQPVLTGGDATIVPGQNYSMQIKADLMVPLAFTGKPDAKAVSTPALRLNGDAMGAPANYTHMVKQKVASTLPVDCRITPVFTMEGEEPVSLEDFILDEKHREVEFSHQFRPTKDGWSATLHYIVTPINGNGEFFTKDRGLTVKDAVFTANLEKNQ